MRGMFVVELKSYKMIHCAPTCVQSVHVISHSLMYNLPEVLFLSSEESLPSTKCCDPGIEPWDGCTLPPLPWPPPPPPPDPADPTELCGECSPAAKCGDAEAAAAAAAGLVAAAPYHAQLAAAACPLNMRSLS